MARKKRLRELGYADYVAYLRSPHWQRLRARYLGAVEMPQACICGESEALQLHHKTYERIGEERLDDLVPLCGRCHSLVHVLERRGDVDLDLHDLCDAARAFEYESSRSDIADDPAAVHAAFVAYWQVRHQQLHDERQRKRHREKLQRHIARVQAARDEHAAGLEAAAVCRTFTP